MIDCIAVTDRCHTVGSHSIECQITMALVIGAEFAQHRMIFALILHNALNILTQAFNQQ
ncbi:hypothetical protein D3C78_1689100 [compost metagenome]